MSRLAVAKVAHHLQAILDDLVFVGGCAAALLVPPPADANLRPTDDVDCVMSTCRKRGEKAVGVSTWWWPTGNTCFPTGRDARRARRHHEGSSSHRLTDSIDTGTPSGRFFFHVLASLAEMERELTMERTRAGLAGGRKRQMTDSKIVSAKKLLASGVPPRDVAKNLGGRRPYFG